MESWEGVCQTSTLLIHPLKWVSTAVAADVFTWSSQSQSVNHHSTSAGQSSNFLLCDQMDAHREIIPGANGAESWYVNSVCPAVKYINNVCSGPACHLSSLTWRQGGWVVFLADHRLTGCESQSVAVSATVAGDWDQDCHSWLATLSLTSLDWYHCHNWRYCHSWVSAPQRWLTALTSIIDNIVPTEWQYWHYHSWLAIVWKVTASWQHHWHCRSSCDNIVHVTTSTRIID